MDSTRAMETSTERRSRVSALVYGRDPGQSVARSGSPFARRLARLVVFIALLGAAVWLGGLSNEAGPISHAHPGFLLGLGFFVGSAAALMSTKTCDHRASTLDRP